MKTILTFLSLALCAMLHAQVAIDVENPSYDGWKVTGDGVIAIQGPTGTRVKLSEEFVTPNTNWTPSKIQCVWSAEYVAVFSQHPRLTEIAVFNLTTGKKLSQKFHDKMPAWYENCHVIKDTPAGEWVKNTLRINTIGFPAAGNSVKAQQILRIEGDQFATYPTQPPAAEAQKGLRQPAGTKPTGKPVQPKRSLEFGSP